MAERLPDDILHALVNELSTDEVKALRSVCRAFGAVTSRHLFTRLKVTCHGVEGDRLESCLAQYSLLPVSQYCSMVDVWSRRAAYNNKHRFIGFEPHHSHHLARHGDLWAFLGHIRSFRFSNVESGSRLAPLPGCLNALFHGMRASLVSLTICGSFFESVFTSNAYGVDDDQPPFFSRLEQLRIRRLEDEQRRTVTNCYSVAGFLRAHSVTLKFCQVFVDYCTLRDQDRMLDVSGEPPPFIIERGHDGFQQPSDMHPGVWQVLRQLLLLGNISQMKTYRPECTGEDFGWVWIRHGFEDTFAGREGEIFE